MNLRKFRGKTVTAESALIAEKMQYLLGGLSAFAQEYKNRSL
jgi:hypothetical protein